MKRETANDYRQTLNLPHTDFPMKANLPQREPETLCFWEDLDIYARIQQQTAGREQYILHDGPPYTSGDIHLGQALNKILKDIVVKFKSMQGFDAPYVPGWDMHGLPTEMRALRTFDLDRREIDPMELRRRAHETALHFMEVQRRQFKRLGVRGEWEHPYLTVDPAFEAAVLGIFRDLVAHDAVYRGLKPVYWCATCETALAEAEIEYAPATSPSIYVKFPVVGDLRERFPSAPPDLPAFFVIWTTTPWTLPANLAIAVHPAFEYALVRANDELLVVANDLVAPVMQAIGRADYEVIETRPGDKLEAMRAQHPFVERESVLVLADYVTLEQGTGLVHTAPGHGQEDFETGRAYDLPVLSPLDNRGVFTDEGGKFAGMRYDQADPAILAEMRERGVLLASEDFEHSYPHCWRCHQPIIFRATEQWFVAVDKFTRQALEAIDGATWVPPWGRDRITGMVAERPDWCISRQRAWGIPLPAFYCLGCGAVLLTPEVVDAVRAVIAERGSDAWFQLQAADFLPADTCCASCGRADFRKETDILDVWFDAGSTHAAVLETRGNLRSPADLYLEGSDQHRGWFQASLWTSIIARGRAPYKCVLTHGFFLDETGRKMSKSLQNIVDPNAIADRYGADILRLWVAYVDFKYDMPMSETIFEQVIEAYRRIRNTVRFMLANLYDFDPAADALEPGDLLQSDRWALHRLQELAAKATRAYEEFEFHRVYHGVNEFCAVDMSAFYLDMLKDRLYTTAAGSRARRSAQTALYGLAHGLARLLAPILSYTAEEIWRHLPGNHEESVQLAPWPAPDERWLDEDLARRWERILRIRDEVNGALEQARTTGVVDQPLHAGVTLYARDDEADLLRGLGDDLARVLIVSHAAVKDAGEAPPGAFVSSVVDGLTIEVAPAAGSKCARCWLVCPSVGERDDHPGLCARCADVIKE
ncbi:MAG: isoleucine--tRNA ligase [Armatimonadota bacterium]|nr:MAG: isoleucine--tRNA ligase [Armatimonadota bacterium]